MFWLAPAYHPQLRMLNFVLFGEIAWPRLDFPSYQTRTELRLNCQVFNIQHWYDQPTAKCHLPSFCCAYWSSSKCPSSMLILPRHLSSPTRWLSCSMAMMSFDELSKTGLRNLSSTLTAIDEGLQVQFMVPSSNFVFLRFGAIRTATYVANDNLNQATLSSRKGRKWQIHRLNNCKGDS